MYSLCCVITSFGHGKFGALIMYAADKSKIRLHKGFAVCTHSGIL